MKKHVVVGVMTILFALISLPLSAAEKAKMKLPDGIYMYASEVQKQKDGSDRVGFGKFFVVYNKKIFSSKDFVKKFGITKLNKLFGGNKKNKILCGGEVVGASYNCKYEKDETIDKKDATFDCDESYVIKNFKEGPAYGRESTKIQGSAVRCLAVPEEYKEVKIKVYNTIQKEEVEKVAKLSKEKLYPLVENEARRMLTSEEILESLDKIYTYNGDFYIGIYKFAFKTAVDEKNWAYWDRKMIFSVNNQNVHFITATEDEENWITICGMLDFDDDGVNELIIERTFLGEEADDSKIIMEIYKQKADGNWTLIWNQ